MKKNSIGNDIVALAGTNADRAGNQKFYSKFLRPSEASLFCKNDFSISFVQYIWLCWSIKESAYKFQKRLQPSILNGGWKINIAEINPPVNPHAFNWNNKSAESDCMPVECCYVSTAILHSKKYYSWSLITDAFIYTVTANEEDCKNIYWGINAINESSYNNQSNEVKKLMLKKFNEAVIVPAPEILKNAAGIPYIKQYPQIPVSFTHHHFFVAYAFVAENVSVNTMI